MLQTTSIFSHLISLSAYLRLLDCNLCHLPGLATRLIAAAEAEAAARGCSQTVHFTYAFQARALYERNGYELVGRVEDFPSRTDVLWYRKRLNPPKSPPSRERPRSEKPVLVTPLPAAEAGTS